MSGTIIEFNLTWYQIAILTMLYLNKGEISKQKLNELLYLIYEELKNIDPLDNLNFHIDIKTKEMEIFTFNGDANFDIILNILSLFWEAINYNPKNNMVYLTDEGYRIAKGLMNDPEFKDEVDIIIKVTTQYKDLSEEGLMNLILENLKHS
jgi:hypothetical protein